MWRAIGGLCLVGWLALSVRQLTVWTSNRTLWTQAVAVSPTSERAALNLAAASMEADDCPAAFAAFSRAAELASDLKSCAVLTQQRDWLTAFCPVPDWPPSRCWP